MQNEKKNDCSPVLSSVAPRLIRQSPRLWRGRGLFCLPTEKYPWRESLLTGSPTFNLVPSLTSHLCGGVSVMTLYIYSTYIHTSSLHRSLCTWNSSGRQCYGVILDHWCHQQPCHQGWCFWGVRWPGRLIIQTVCKERSSTLMTILLWAFFNTN